MYVELVQLISSLMICFTVLAFPVLVFTLLFGYRYFSSRVINNNRPNRNIRFNNRKFLNKSTINKSRNLRKPVVFNDHINFKFPQQNVNPFANVQNSNPFANIHNVNNNPFNNEPKISFGSFNFSKDKKPIKPVKVENNDNSVVWETTKNVCSFLATLPCVQNLIDNSINKGVEVINETFYPNDQNLKTSATIVSELAKNKLKDTLGVNVDKPILIKPCPIDENKQSETEKKDTVIVDSDDISVPDFIQNASNVIHNITSSPEKMNNLTENDIDNIKNIANQATSVLGALFSSFPMQSNNPVTTSNTTSTSDANNNSMDIVIEDWKQNPESLD